MKRSASARSHNAKDTRITNYKAEELFELLYWRDDDGDCLSLSTRQVARALTFGGARVPTLRRNQSFPSGDFWTDPKWLHAQLQEMDLKIESRSLRQGSERTARSRDAVAEAEARAAAEDEAREREAEEAAAATRPMSADVVRQQRAMARLTAKSLKTLRLTKHALHERHALVQRLAQPVRAAAQRLPVWCCWLTGGRVDVGVPHAAAALRHRGSVGPGPPPVS